MTMATDPALRRLALRTLLAAAAGRGLGLGTAAATEPE